MEQQLAIIKNVPLLFDIDTRYDLYFTDKRIAIVCIGNADSVDNGKSGRRLIVGDAPAAFLHAEDTKKNKQNGEEPINNLSLDEILQRSEKSCFYTYEEIVAVKLISGTNKLKFIILSKEYESKFLPDEGQFQLLIDLLPTIETLKNKLSIFSVWKAAQAGQTANRFCKYCGFRNDLDALFCENCGKELKSKFREEFEELTCNSCGTRNKAEASFCRECGSPIR